MPDNAKLAKAHGQAVEQNWKANGHDSKAAEQAGRDAETRKLVFLNKWNPNNR